MRDRLKFEEHLLGHFRRHVCGGWRCEHPLRLATDVDHPITFAQGQDVLPGQHPYRGEDLALQLAVFAARHGDPDPWDCFDELRDLENYAGAAGVPKS